MTPEETISQLNALIETCKDAELGYRSAAGAVKNTQLETVFADYSRRRARFAKELQTEVEHLGGTPVDHGTPTGTLFRGWMDMKSALSGGSPAAIIASCETGEESAVAAFESAVNSDLSGRPLSLVTRQFEEIKQAHLRMMRLKEETSGSRFPKND